MSETLPGQEPRVPWGAVLILVIGAFMSILDSSIVNVALPRMMAVFGASTDKIQWVLTGYLLASGVVIPLTAYFCERFGCRRMYIIALGIFTAGSAFCGLAWSSNSIITARVVQAVGGGMLIPVSMAMIFFLVPKEKSGIALGVWGIAAVMGPAIGPTLGGYLVETFSWPWIFTINIPVGIIAIILSLFCLPETPLKKDLKPDLMGAALIVAACFSLLLALSKGQDEGWTSQYIVTLFVVAGFTSVLFAFWESSVPNPLIPMQLFRNPVMLASILSMAVITVLLFAVVFLIPIYAQNLLGYSPMKTGILMLPMALATGILMPVSGKIFDKYGAFYLGLLGFLIIIWFTYELRWLSLATSYRELQVLLALRAAGFGLAMMPLSNAGMLTLPEHLVNSASAAINLARQLAGSLGVAWTTYMVTERQSYHMAVLGDNINYNSPLAVTTLNQIQAYLSRCGMSSDTSWNGTLEIVRGLILKQSYMNGINDTLVILALAGVCAIPLVFMLSKQRVEMQKQKDGIV